MLCYVHDVFRFNDFGVNLVAYTMSLLYAYKKTRNYFYGENA